MKRILYIIPILLMCTVVINAQSLLPVGTNNIESQSSVLGSSLSKQPQQSLGNRLSGKISGLTVMQKGGEAGENEPQLLLRGINSYNNANMLIMVDGFESEMGHLMPEEIADITVLKDAASLAVYGIRGANGVLLVKTKRGVEGKMKMQLDLRVGFIQPLQMPQFTDAYGYASLYNEALSNDLGKWIDYYSVTDLQQYRYGSDPYFHPNINWQKETLASQKMHESGTLSITGGNKKVKLYTVLGFMNTPKFYQNNKKAFVKDLSKLGEFTRYNIRSNIDIEINKIFGLMANLGGAITDNTTPNAENFMSMLYSTPPNAFPIKNENGTWAANAIYGNNPVASLYSKGKRSTHLRNFQTDFSFIQNLDTYVKGLSFKESISFYGYAENGYNIKKDYVRYQMFKNADGTIATDPIGGSNPEYAINEDESTRKQQSRINYMMEAFYLCSLGSHNVSAQVGGTYSKLIVDGNNVPYLNAGIFGRAQYDFQKKYSLLFSFAYNGSENLPTKNRFGFFPSLALGWKLSNEEWLLENMAINLLNVRVSAGMVGNSDLGATRFGYQTYYNTTDANLNIGSAGSTSLSGLIEGRIGNPYISYEKNYKYNMGIDALFWNSFSVTVDGFYEIREGVLATRDAIVPSVVAALLPYENIGKVSNIGGEIALSYNQQIGNFAYALGGNFSYAKSKIIYQAENARSEEYLYRTGLPVGQQFGLESVGFFKSQSEIDDSQTPKHTFAPVQPGDIKYKDQNHDNLIDENDEIAMGYTPIPQINFGLSMNLSYCGFDFFASLYGQANRSIFLNGNTVFAFYNNGQAPTMANNRWAYYPKQGIDTRSIATYPRLTTSNNDNNYRPSSVWIRDASFVRLQDVELGYTFNHALVKRAHISMLRFYLSGSNLFTLSALKEFDPESLMNYPLNRSVSFGLSIKY